MSHGAARGGDVEAAAESVTLPVEADWSWDQCAVCGSVEVKDRRWVVLLMKSPTIARAGWCAVCGCQKDLSITERTIPAAALAAQPAAPQPTEGAAEVVCTNCEADDLGCTACGAHGTLAARSQRPEAHVDRESLGRQVREVWVEWAREQENPKPTWLVEWDDLPEPDREVDRRIGEALFARGLAAQRPEGVTVTEWGVRYSRDHDVEERNEESAMQAHRQPTTARAYTRQRTTFPDVVTEWAEVSDHTEAGGGRG